MHSASLVDFGCPYLIPFWPVDLHVGEKWKSSLNAFLKIVMFGSRLLRILPNMKKAPS